MRRLLGIIQWVARAAWLAILALLVRPRCAACDRVLEDHAVFCPPCLDTIQPAAGAARIDGLSLRAFGMYGGALGDSLRRFKYRARPELARPLGDLLRHRARTLRSSFDLIVPVPLHPRRLAMRGYNQAALLATPVARELGVPFAASALRRVVDTPAQAQLDGAARRRNVRNAFVANPRRVTGLRILLVDDIATTGATLRSCADALRRAGALSCEALVVARAARP